MIVKNYLIKSFLEKWTKYKKQPFSDTLSNFDAKITMLN